ncbi:MAG TPA: class I SAM-dependent methyltransferase [Bacteroidia bacterium]|jgi:SAM-dependent methyltransferase|nr:class I SAM-dependent methyltransferase [Bacteroidia bacterium]
MSFLRYKQAYHLDDPRATLAHREIILRKPFLKKVYLEWYATFKAVADQFPGGKLLEIGSGGGFLKEIIPTVITSDILPLDCCERVFSAEQMPFQDGELQAIFMLNVFHHIPHPWMFLKEAQRVLSAGGKIVMIEPANSTFSRFIYQTFHHEPFDITGGWEIESSGPLSGSNQALPYIYFERDSDKFSKEFPSLHIKHLEYHTPLRYLISGGVSMRALVPSWSFGFFRGLEQLFSGLSRKTGMFMTVELEKK